MTKISRKYLTLGLRRDFNLQDLPNKTAALDNLLDNLVNDPDTSKSFKAEDLEAIIGIRNTDVTNQSLQYLNGMVVSYDVLDGQGGISKPIVEPLILIKDRLERAKTVTSENPAILGGDGLIATFIPSDDINSGTKSSNGDTIFDKNNDQLKYVFWNDSGDFRFGNLINTAFRDLYGGIQWEGYFVPSLKDPNVNISVFTTGLFMVEADTNNDGVYEVLRSAYAPVRNLTVISGSGSNTFQLGQGEAKFVSIGDIVDEIDEVPLTVTEVNTTNDTIVLSQAYTLGNPTLMTVSRVLGTTITRTNFRLPPRELANQIKIRFSFWYPVEEEFPVNKFIEFEYISSSLTYANLYSVQPSSIFQESEIRSFLSNSISPHQQNIGAASIPGEDRNKNFYINNSILSIYTPDKKTKSEILKGGIASITFNRIDNVVISDIALPSVEIGSIVIPTNPSETRIGKQFRVKDSISGSVKVLTGKTGSEDTIPVEFVDHRGFVKWFAATSSGNTVTILNDNINELRRGFILIKMSGPTSGYIRITSLVNSSTFTTSSGLDLVGQQIICVYSDSSLIDESKDVFCEGVFGQVLSSTVNSGNSLTLTSVSGIAVGMFVQYDGSIPANTTVTNISGNTITMLNNVSSPILASSTIVFVPANKGGTINREGCVIPLNTAPPFEGTDRGLSTAGRDIKSAVGIPSFTVTSNQVRFQLNSSDILSGADTGNFDKKVLVKARVGTQLRNFSILSKKV